MIQQMAKDFDVLTGLSDHTLGATAPVVAVCLGAKVIEKHFILDKSIGGPDSSFSLDKEEFTEMVKSVRLAEKAMGNISYEPTEKSKQGRNFSRSLYFVKNLQEGEVISEESIRSVRPGFGMHPKHFHDVIGKTVSKSVEIGDRVDWNVIDQ
jgi:pseudaminic acid synthase